MSTNTDDANTRLLLPRLVRPLWPPPRHAIRRGQAFYVDQHTEETLSVSSSIESTPLRRCADV